MTIFTKDSEITLPDSQVSADTSISGSFSLGLGSAEAEDPPREQIKTLNIDLCQAPSKAAQLIAEHLPEPANRVFGLDRWIAGAVSQEIPGYTVEYAPGISQAWRTQQNGHFSSNIGLKQALGEDWNVAAAHGGFTIREANLLFEGIRCGGGENQLTFLSACARRVGQVINDEQIYLAGALYAHIAKVSTVGIGTAGIGEEMIVDLTDNDTVVEIFVSSEKLNDPAELLSLFLPTQERVFEVPLNRETLVKHLSENIRIYNPYDF